ncbi:MAG: D-alanyl-D-alanine carboxypeptidase family protein [Maritimibacter sp.]
MLASIATRGVAAPYAAMVVDARSGEVLHARNADTQLHPASLTKMMTLYIVFEAIENGEISPDTLVTISKKAASEPPSKVGFRAGSQVRLRYLIRAAGVKSANDAATALGEAISGSEAAFARRMNRTAKALGMSRTHFKNAHGLTEAGHMSTARDMTTMGRHLFFDYPGYYNLFSRRTADVGGKTLPNTNSRFLNAYKGADGIKTGYTRAAGFNLVASAERGSERIIATVFGGQSTASRNAKVAELMDLGFRTAPTRVATRRPNKPPYLGNQGIGAGAPAAIASTGERPGAVGKTIRLVTAPKTSIIPRARPGADPILVADADVVDAVVADLVSGAVVANEDVTRTDPSEVIRASVSAPASAPTPPARPREIILASVERARSPGAPEIVTRLSTSGGRHYGITVGLFASHHAAERVLLKTALNELATLGDALRKVGKTRRGYNANFVGMTKEAAELACRRLEARNSDCKVIGG